MGIRQDVLLAAFLLSDGGITARGKESWTIYFRNKDKSVIDEFQKVLKNSCGRMGYYVKRTDGSWFIRLHSKELANRLFQLSKSYRTKACNNFPICRHLTGKRSSCELYGTQIIEGIEYPKAEIPKQIFKNRQLAKDFLKIYASCDGGISVVPAKNSRGSLFLVRKIFISVKHPRLNEQLTKLLEKLGFSPSRYEDQLRLTKKEDLEKFRNEIGFIKGAKISKDSKFLFGHEKTQILDMTIHSYKNPQSLLGFLLKIRSSDRFIRD